MGSTPTFKHDPWTARLIALIEAFSIEAGISTTRVCTRAVEDSQLYKRMTTKGHSCTLPKAYRLEKYILKQRRLARARAEARDECVAEEAPLGGCQSHNSYGVSHQNTVGHEHVKEA